MKFINMLKEHLGWVAFGFFLAIATPAMMIALGITLAQALYIALWMAIIFFAAALVWFFIKMIRNEVFWRKNH